MASAAGVAVTDFGLLRALSAGGWAGLVGQLADGEVSGPVGSVVSLLDGVDPCALEGLSRVDYVRAVERVRAMVDGMAVRALLGVAAATEGRGLAEEEARHEVGAALGLSPGTAGERTWVAVSLARRLPATLAMLEAGEVSYLKAAHLVSAVWELPDELAARVEARVLRTAPDQTLSVFKRSVARAVLAVDPASAAERHEKAKAARTMERMPQPDGMESLWATMPASSCRDVWTTLTRDAKAEQAARAALGCPTRAWTRCGSTPWSAPWSAAAS
jgi:hypothetical protein